METSEKLYTNLKKIADKNGEIEFEAEIPVAALDAYIKEELARAAADFSWPGFRKGKVPEQIVREHTNEMAILDAAADEALHDVIPEIAADEKLSVLGRSLPSRRWRRRIRSVSKFALRSPRRRAAEL